MKKVFISNSHVSEKQFLSATHTAEIHFYENAAKCSFRDAIACMNEEGYDPRINTREKAYKQSMQGSMHGRNIFYLDNIVEL